MTPTSAATVTAKVPATGPRANPQAARSSSPSDGLAKTIGYGLPCAKCRTYYRADLPACPVCKGSERVSVTPRRTPTPAGPAESLPDPVLLEQERERFLREFNAHMATLQMPGNATSLVRCKKEENHQNGVASATICQDCYDHLQERVDVLEAALHIDLKEAAQIVYDAVWADPSDSNKTYENAANALLTELRKRSGVPQTFALLQTPVED